MRVANTGLVLRLNGSTRFIENDSGRQLTWGQTSAPRLMPARWISIAFRWAPPGVVSTAV